MSQLQRQPKSQRRSSSRAQSGAGLVVALIMLIVMSLGAIALVRSVETGSLVAGNFAFRQSALLASDAGSEAAVQWLIPLAALPDLYTDQTARGYYASVPDGLDITNSGSSTSSSGVKVLIDWDNDQCQSQSGIVCVAAAPALATDAAGNSIRSVIHRLCLSAGSPTDAANSCLLYQDASGGSAKKSGISYGNVKRFQASVGVYYRITTRVMGPRNTIVFTQTMVHF